MTVSIFKQLAIIPRLWGKSMESDPIDTVLFILTVAAAEAAIGLAILIVLFRNLKTINVDDLSSLKG